MTASSPVTGQIPGPCVVCGDTNYSLSCGGPTICPKCDCGNFDAATVLKQAKVIEQLRADLAAARSLPAQSQDRFAIAQIICCGGKCILEGCEGGCILNSPEHDGDLKKADMILAALSGNAGTSESNHFEHAKNGVIDWKEEAIRANRLYAEATREIARLKGNAGAVEEYDEGQLAAGNPEAPLPATHGDVIPDDGSKDGGDWANGDMS